MNINGAFNIKYDGLKVDGPGKFINTSNIKESDVSIMVSVKAVNQTITDHSLTQFQPIPNIKEASPQRLIEVYGDSFISGWQEGGEFLAVISIKAKNRDESQTIAANAKIAFSSNKNPPPESDKKELAADLSAKFDKRSRKKLPLTMRSEKDWDFDTMKEVALKFPDLCARTPMRTHALITKYTALRSFYTTQTFDLPLYDKTGTYTNVLQEAYLDYKSILGAIQVLAFDASEGTKALIVNPRAARAAEQAVDEAKAVLEKTGEDSAANSTADNSQATDIASIEGSVVDVPAVTKTPAKVITLRRPVFEKPFLPTIPGLEEARLQCRFMMNRIILETDNITIKPEIATDETRQVPYLSPLLFKMLLPIGVDVPPEASQAAQAVAASKVDPEALAKKFTALG